MNTLKDILAIYDVPAKKKFDYYEIQDAISKLPLPERDAEAAQYEMLAMSIFEDYDRDIWLPQISQPCVAYWEKRAGETQNPFLSKRYAGLVNDYKKLLTGHEPDYQQIKLRYMESIIEVINGEYGRYLVNCFLLLKPALGYAKAIHNENALQRVKDAMLALNARHRDELETPGYWANVMEAFLKYSDAFTSEERQALVQENEYRYDQLYALCLRNGEETDNYVHLLIDETKLLCAYYEKAGLRDNIAHALKGVYEGIKKSANLCGAIWFQSMLENLQELYRKYHLHSEANRLYVDIQRVGKEALASMSEFEVSEPIPQEMVDGFRTYVLEGTQEEIFSRFVTNHIPDLEREKQYQFDEYKQAPFLSRIVTTHYDLQGNPQAKSGGRDGDWNQFMAGMWQRMVMNAVILRIHIDTMEKTNNLTYEIVMKSFENAPFIQEGHIAIIERGVKAYFDKDLILACHLLIPQFEAAIRQIVFLKGGDILRASSDAKDGDEYKSLEGLLGADEIIELFTEDEVTYFKCLFTAKAGANLRNKLSHGLLSADQFDFVYADRILHAFMVLTRKNSHLV